MAGFSMVSGPQLIDGEVTPEAFTYFCVFTITLLVASRQLLSSAAGDQVVGDTMASASLLGLVIWSVIMINLNTWGKSIRVFESWFNQHRKSRQTTNLEHWHSFKQSVARFLMVLVDMFNVYKCYTVYFILFPMFLMFLVVIAWMRDDILSSVSFVGTAVHAAMGDLDFPYCSGIMESYQIVCLALGAGIASLVVQSFRTTSICVLIGTTMGVATSVQMASQGEPWMGSALGLWMIIITLLLNMAVGDEIGLTLGMFLGFFIAAGTGGSPVVATNFVALAILCLVVYGCWNVPEVSPTGGARRERVKASSTNGGATNQVRRRWYKLPAQDAHEHAIRNYKIPVSQPDDGPALRCRRTEVDIGKLHMYMDENGLVLEGTMKNDPGQEFTKPTRKKFCRLARRRQRPGVPQL